MKSGTQGIENAKTKAYRPSFVNCPWSLGGEDE